SVWLGPQYSRVQPAGGARRLRRRLRTLWWAPGGCWLQLAGRSSGRAGIEIPGFCSCHAAARTARTRVVVGWLPEARDDLLRLRALTGAAGAVRRGVPVPDVRRARPADHRESPDGRRWTALAGAPAGVRRGARRGHLVRPRPVVRTLSCRERGG